MTFTAVVGKDLMAVDNDSLDQLDSKSIISTFKRERKEQEDQEDEGRKIADLVNEIVMDADLPQTPTKKERRPHHGSAMNATLKSPVRHRFNDKLSTLKIMEAKETAKAELVIAFEMLKMMKERGLRADPEAFQCLIDACGRCGDTGRATQLLQRMHEDGIVADGLVYSSLVSAFSANNAWKQASGEALEELPGTQAIHHSPLFHIFLYLCSNDILFHLSSHSFPFRLGCRCFPRHGLEYTKIAKTVLH